MKEATGELNMTVIAVVAIAAVGAFFYTFIWPRIKDSISVQSVCANGANYTSGTQGHGDYVKCEGVQSDHSYKCYYENSDKNGKISTKTTTCKGK